MSEEKLGYYIVALQVAPPGMPGSMTLKMHLGVNAPTGHVQGSGEVTQALPPPFGTTPIPHISGHILHTGFGKDTLLVHLTGEAIRPSPPNEPISIREKFAASLALSSDWEGTGSFTIGSHTVTHCKVTKIKS
jgi:hypothetical protein